MGYVRPLTAGSSMRTAPGDRRSSAGMCKHGPLLAGLWGPHAPNCACPRCGGPSTPWGAGTAQPSGTEPTRAPVPERWAQEGEQSCAAHEAHPSLASQTASRMGGHRRDMCQAAQGHCHIQVTGTCRPVWTGPPALPLDSGRWCSSPAGMPAAALCCPACRRTGSFRHSHVLGVPRSGHPWNLQCFHISYLQAAPQDLLSHARTL